ncbi:hypothetical protein OGAPHI_005760 [Ogataea philodendri]|uniref:Major facilitator superfamily (MFS) profile domain-containing protein n=1 Tax=Ogataea philodendri TaxID=1378263 RepID=A0A9P8T179_9ASCO|nr:uncharacterized protein OGAPHI_005760 [Ogataea philodendri]KAH3662508.1 hypothetical protein OGAPHI_005760 [Ogataea philodendri]
MDSDMELHESIEEKDDNKPDSCAPEGGWAGWMACSAGATVMAMSFGMVNSFGVYQSYYEARYPDISSNTISVVGSLQGFMTFAGALPSTVGMYYLGSQAMVAIGGFIACLSYMFLSITNAPWQIFVVQGVMYGLGSGLMYVQCSAVVFQYFDKRKAAASGIITAGASVAGVYWPIGIRGLINNVGFGWGNRVVGFLYVPMVVFSAIFLKPRLKPPKRKPGQNILRINFRVLLNWRFQLVNISFALCVFGLFPGLFYMDLFCRRSNVNQAVKDYNVAIINASALLGRVSAGYIGDRIGRFNVVIPAMVASGVLPIALWMQAESTAAVVVFCVLWGIASGMFVSVGPALVGQLFSDDLPSYLGTFFPTSSVTALVGPIIGGIFIPQGDDSGTKGFNKLCIFVGVVFLCSSVTYSIARFSYQPRLFAIM